MTTGPAWDAVRAALGSAAGDVDAIVATLARFLDLLKSAGEKQNLTRITDEDAAVEKHALDALLGLELLQDGPLVDVGSGSGVPGLPLAIARPGWKVALVESERRKAAFLDEARRALGLADRVTVHAERAEALARDPDHREAYGCAVVRAVGSVATCLELTLPLVRVGGRAVLYRGPSNPDEELAEARAVAPLLGGGEPLVVARTLPSGAARRLLAVPKLAPAPERYPRRPGIPAKRPLA